MTMYILGDLSDGIPKIKVKFLARMFKEDFKRCIFSLVPTRKVLSIELVPSNKEK